MIVGRLEGVKRLSKHQVADDVEGGAGHPRNDIQRLLPTMAVLAKLLDKQIDVVNQGVLLPFQGRGGESGTKDTAKASVVIRVGSHDALVKYLGKRSQFFWVLGKTVAAMPHDFMPGIRVTVAQFVGCNSNNGPVAIVQIANMEVGFS